MKPVSVIHRWFACSACRGRTSNLVLAKLEGSNPAGSVKDRPALSMIAQAEARGEIRPGDTLIEATSGNTGIALAMAAAIRGYRLILIMPSHMSDERKQAMSAYGARLLEVSQAQGMEGAQGPRHGKCRPGARAGCWTSLPIPTIPALTVAGTGPEIWQQTDGTVTHFVSSMGTTGTIMGCSAYLKQQNPAIEIIGLQPQEGSSIPGIRRWPQAYLPAIYDSARVDRVIDISQQESEHTMREMARQEGIFCGVSSGGAIAAALRLSSEIENAVIVTIVCDRGDRYLSTGVFAGR